MNLKLMVFPFMSALFFCGCQSSEQPQKANTKAAVESKPVAVTSITKDIRSLGFKYLLSRQNKDGSYGSAKDSNMRLQTTALCVWSFSSSQRQYREADGPFISKAVDFILKAQAKDGSFGSESGKVDTTLLCAMALDSLPGDGHAKQIKSAESYLEKNAKDAGKEINASGYEAAALKSSLKDSYFSGLLMTAKDKITAKSSDAAEWISSTAVDIKKMQNRKSDFKPEFGSFQHGKNRYDADPVAATAVACAAADRIRANAKKFGLK
ncbi:MAG: hypothetical protein JXR97_04095 [Planctomycetes bacterium]|nr:hypothetical protein [Planctomycetota bacterium]